MLLNLEKLRRDYKLNRKKNPATAERVLTLIEITKIKMNHYPNSFKSGQRMQMAALLSSVGFSLRTIQRWEQSYRTLGVVGLDKKGITGRKAKELDDHVKSIIGNYRKLYRWGSEAIQAHLRFDDGYDVTRFKIDRYLDVSGLRERYPCTTRKKKVKQKKKHTKKVKVDIPGAHTQMDVKYQIHLLENKQKCYVYNFIDHASNWSFKYAYPAFNANNTKDFMERLLTKCPFEIYRLQTDNGVEFTFKYVSVSDDPKEHPLDTFCNQYSITHKLIPPGEKELQGLVERSHRQDDQELFSRINPNNLQEFNQQLEEFWKWRNKKRRFKKLAWLTPDEWLEKYIVRSVVFNFINPKQKGPWPFSRVSSEPQKIDKKIKLLEDDRAQNTAQERTGNDEKNVKLAA